MSNPIVKTLRIASGHTQKPLSKTQKSFNVLIKQIERKRAELVAWEAVIHPYRSKFANELVPLHTASVDMQIKMARGLDRARDRMKLSKAERRKVAALILEFAESILMDRDDAQIKALHEKYLQPGDHRDSSLAMQSLLEDVLGLDLGDDLDFMSPDELMERGQRKIQEEQEKFETEEAAWEERQSRRKKSAKQLARQAREEADEQKLRQSIREIYRKLASALHPDRELDPIERERKTALMQRVNQAYEKNNLLQLLELQLELDHIDQGAIDKIGEERLKDYIKILREQSLGLDIEIERVASGFMSPFNGSPYVVLRPESVMHNLAAAIANAKRANRELKNDLSVFEDVNTLKSWLRYMRQTPAADYDDNAF